MKKRFVLMLSIVMLVGILFGCSARENEQEETPVPTPVGITLSFNTTIDGYVIAPIFLDGSPKYMPDTPFYVGRTFLGWYYDLAYTRPFYVTDGLTEDTTLYAKWRINVDTSKLEKVEGKEKDAGGIQYRKKDDGYYVCGYEGILPEVTLPDVFNGKAVVGIEDGAFNGTVVRKIILSASIETVEGGAFAGANKIENVIVADSSPYFQSKEGVLYSKDGSSLVCLPASKTSTTYNVAQETVSIRPYALYGCSASIVFSQSTQITQIEEYAFAGFSGTVTLPRTVTFIQKHAFSGADCVVSFPTDCGLTALRNGEFDGYIGARIVLPSTITSLSGAPFSDCIASIDLSCTGLTELSNDAFNGYAGVHLEIPASVRSLKSNCFYKCKAEIVFDERSDLQTVGENSFSNFAGKVTFPSSVRRVERYAFFNAQTGAEIIFTTRQSEIVIDEKAFYASHAQVTYR